jgi:hypothetical protein
VGRALEHPTDRFYFGEFGHLWILPIAEGGGEDGGF